MHFESISFLWFLLLLTLITISYFMYMKDNTSLLLIIVSIIFLRLYTPNMNIILFVSLFIVSIFNMMSLMNVEQKSVEYHILNRVNYKNESGTLLKEKTTIHNEEIVYTHKDDWLDMNHIIYNWNKTRPIID